MIIRKQMKFEGAHIVRNCTSLRCSRSWHGHSYKVEFKFTSNSLDEGGMIIDFGLMKPMKDLVDMFDHTTVIWSKESDEIKDFFFLHSERRIEMGISPSAENLALVFLKLADAIVKQMQFKNGEKFVRAYSVRVHETESGWAEAYWEDVEDMLKGMKISDVITDISDSIVAENRMAKGIVASETDALALEIVNPIPEHQVQSGGHHE